MHFCTYFDHRYLPRGLALYYSLKRHRPDVVLWVLCLSTQCANLLALLNLPDVRIIDLAALEHFDPELPTSKSSRTLIEYYFTCSPCLPRYVLTLEPGIDRILYVDSDFYFYSDPEPIIAEAGSASVAITPHRFTARSIKTHGKFGRYNVGLMMFRNDDRGLRCLDWWRAQCLEWCRDHVDPSSGRYADQGYLDHFHEIEPSTHAIAHRGVNLAPWNIADSRLTQVGDLPFVDGRALICFHFQGLKRLDDGRFNSNLTPYGARLDAVSRELIYKPYIRELSAVLESLAERGLIESVGSGIRKPSRPERLQRLKESLGLYRALIAGNLITP
ncbi:MAG TPA: hypothetical protein VGE51_04680 [Fontimonas sp.]